ncbi:zinc finger BED domain-containing protein RICESLEEPER 2-like [Lolium rigidum]|uniref:zinc finger BED domain-containing protein RICESLEEPER 2-like n=1 Tax=Lolium rigidum TaxID=89674 RepID=UPI001F5CC027|nr:zinc finger BED domain-containing protein RICESLEEPER 2-like [Lolium rigidum]
MSIAGFRHVLAGMYPTSSMISRVGTEEQFITMFQNERLKLKEEIAFAPGGVFLSVGNWELGEKVITCMAVHFIDREWKRHRKIISCFCSELGDAESEHYISILPNWENMIYLSSNLNSVSRQTVTKYSLENKLLGVVLPEPVKDSAMILDLEKILTGKNYLLAKCKLINIPCSVNVVHQLFISVPNGLIQETSIKWFGYMTHSSPWKEKYQQILSRMCLHRPSFGSKRWYSTFYLMEAVLQFNKTFPDPIQEDSSWYPQKPSSKSLEAAESFCLVARPIYQAIRVISSSRSAINSYFHALWSVRTVLQESSGNVRMERVLDIKDMLKTFDKEWKKLYLWLSVAVVLDPRYKMRFLEHCFRQAYGNGAKTYISDVRGKIYELFFRYSCHADQQSRNNDMEMNIHGSDPLDVTDHNYHEQATYENSLRELHAYLDGELCPLNDDNYLSSEALPQNGHFDILKWWKANASIYPALAILARDVLAISACAVSEESAFGETDERVYLFNQKLSHEMAEAVICTQDWFQDSGRSDANGGNCSVPI